ncbi:MAG TPA: FtsX-like permease family protein, partial [Bryobacteraceae bacterium]
SILFLSRTVNNSPRKIRCIGDSGRPLCQQPAASKTFHLQLHSWDRNPLKGSDGLTYSIVGVCADWHLDHLRAAVLTATYRSFLQAPQGRGPGAAPAPADVHRPSAPIEFEIRFSGGEANAIQGIRHTVRALDATLAVTDVRAATQQIENDRSQERLMASLAAVFGSLALILAAIGIYGVMAYAVARRTREIGIRMALGARPGSVAWMVLRDTLTLATAGIAAGIPALLTLSPMLDRLLAPGWENRFVYGVNPRDPAIVVLTALGLVIACIFAAYFPARRAARVDPIRALRHE